MGEAMPVARSLSLAAARRELPEWLPVLAGLLALYVPTFYGLFNGIWTSEDQAHGPIILALSLWLLWRQWPEMLAKADPAGQKGAGGWITLGAGLFLYVLGRSQGIVAFEIASFILVR